jgi:hypothetical protein
MFEHDICDFEFYPHAVHALKTLRLGKTVPLHPGVFQPTQEEKPTISYKMSQIRNQGKALEKNPVTAHYFITKTAEAILCN